MRRVFTTRAEDSDRASSRFGTRASSSSKKITQGMEERARTNTCRTARSDSPIYLFRSSGPLMEMKFARDSLATALARRVLPHPGGPQSNTPVGAVMPTRRYFSGCRIGSTMAVRSSSLTGRRAPMSAQVVSGMVAKPSRLEEGWILGSAVRKSV